MGVGNPKIARLLEHPAIWRGRSAARRAGLRTGFAALDAHLPDEGWPRTGLIEILVVRFGSGELTLLMPALAALTRAAAARWCVWVAPPLVPFAPALAACGVMLDRVAVVARGGPALWAFEQTLGSGACDAVLGWVRSAKAREIRRLQLAAERGRTLGVLFRPRRAAREASAAVLRLGVEPLAGGARITLIKGRSPRRGVLDLRWAGD
ncbi:MAG: translesion DNA synthesis-associated protein ImuA [Gammaproteobacteria bacterium]|nr:translesion DNA synthesis-associated protein ImuA [Gammaproteobacteria bacterium]MBV8307225.1 translesion DNA synthesis-associated protein ImuA [Gammaproteobacteria bacterium]MBV8405539.1 translesion DNA synthesis-associated protein ImuA [Gammaproteobacteria bacterium]